MDLQQLNEVLDQLETYLQSASQESIKEENKVFVYSEISNLRVNPTPEHLQTFMETLGQYLYLPKQEVVSEPPVMDQTPAVMPVITSPTDEDQRKIEELVASLKALRNTPEEPA